MTDTWTGTSQQTLALVGIELPQQLEALMDWVAAYDAHEALWALALVVAGFLAGRLLASLCLKLLSRAASKTRSLLDDAVIEHLAAPLRVGLPLLLVRGLLPLVELPRATLAWLARQPWGFAVLALPLLAASAAYPNGILAPAGDFLPEWNEWLYHGCFFAFGLMLHGRQAELFAQFQRHWAGYAVAGLACYLIATAVNLRQGPVLLTAYAYHCISWLWSFAAIGLALRLVPSRHAVLGYLSDSAYWVYLLHYPLTILFGALLFEQPLSALAKMAINIAATTLVCLGSYELFVRHGAISQLLNGKRHPRRGRERSREHWVEEPRLVVEVLSRSTQKHDMTGELAFHRSFASIDEILLVRFDRRWCELWQRVGAHWSITDHAGSAELPLRITTAPIPLDEIYTPLEL